MRLLLLAIAATAGAGWLQLQPQLPPLRYAVVTLLPLLAALSLTKKTTDIARNLSFVCWLLCFLFAGFFWAAVQAHFSLASELADVWRGRDIRIEGVISELTQPGERSTRFVMDVERVLTVGAQVPRRVLINWYTGWPGQSDSSNGPQLLAGQRWQMVVRLRRPHGNFNPHGFDTEVRLLERGIRATGYVRDVSSAKLINSMVRRPDYAVQRLRENVRRNLFDLLGERRYAGILVALAVGDRGAISEHQWTVLTRTGTNHLMSISGLHITLVSGLAFVLTLRAWRNWPRLATRIAPLRAATLYGLAAALVYAALAGFAIPAQRAICMLVVVAVSVWTGWRWPISAILGAALLFVLVLDPMAVTSAGFWLSFAAVAAIVTISSARNPGDGLVQRWLHVQWAITIMLIPLLLMLFQQVSVVSPLANAIAIPLVSLCIAPLALMLIVLPVELIATLAHTALELGFTVLKWLSELPGAVWRQHAPVVWTLPLAAAGVALVMLPRGFPGRYLGFVLMLPMFAVRPPTPGPGEMWFTLLDVGQGLSAVVRTSNHAILFDSGPDYHGLSDAGRSIVVPYLRGEGIGYLDLLVVSHDDLDHSGGAGSVVAAVGVGEIVSSVTANLDTSDKAKGDTDTAGGKRVDTGTRGWNPVSRCRAGQQWNFNGVQFEMLHPEDESYARANVVDNDRSCVLRIESAHGVVLLPADIERRSERKLVETAASRLNADLLVAPHHGSGTSSSANFVTAVKPKLVLFPVGYANRYGHPHPSVKARYQKTGARLMRTDESGAVTVRFSETGTDITAWRDSHRRYWHTRHER